jgi:uncharacterized protein YcbK (DUF882 family)
MTKEEMNKKIVISDIRAVLSDELYSTIQRHVNKFSNCADAMAILKIFFKINAVTKKEFDDINNLIRRYCIDEITKKDCIYFIDKVIYLYDIDESEEK